MTSFDSNITILDFFPLDSKIVFNGVKKHLYRLEIQKITGDIPPTPKEFDPERGGVSPHISPQKEEVCPVTLKRRLII